ncbi:MAG: microcystin-dependent protein [Roseivirga sp.]|jgi:microcystin-dependent protein
MKTHFTHYNIFKIMDPFLGQIQPFGFSFAPRGWETCSGQIIAISNNTALFALLGATFGGDGRTTFGLPDLRGRSMVGMGNNSAPTFRDIMWGETGGVNSVTISTSQMPSHNHILNAFNGQGDSRAPGKDLNATSSTGDFNYKGDTPPNTTMASAAIGDTGGNEPIEINSPYLGLNICIAVQGIFPSRS